MRRDTRRIIASGKLKGGHSNRFHACASYDKFWRKAYRQAWRNVKCQYLTGSDVPRLRIKRRWAEWEYW